MSTKEEQENEIKARFAEAVKTRDEKIAAMKAVVEQIDDLKADVSEARAVVARIRANAKKAGVKLPKSSDNDDE